MPHVTAAVLTVAQVLAAIGAMLATLLFARIMGPQDYGTAMSVISALLLISLLLSLNMEGTAMRFVLQGDADQKSGFANHSRVIVLALSGFSACLVLPIGLLFLKVDALSLITGGLIAMLLALSRLTARIGAALDHARAASLPRMLSRPIVFAVSAVAFVSLGLRPTPLAIVALFLLATALALLVQTLLLRPAFRRVTRPQQTITARLWISTGLKLTPSLLFLELFRDVVLTSASFTLTRPELGILAAALSLIALPGFVLVACDIAFSPKISKAIAADDHIGRDAVLRIAAMTRIAGTVACALPLALGRDLISELLGPQFHATGSIVLILLAIPLTRMLLGNPVLLLSVTGFNASVFYICGTGAALTVISIAVASTTFGIVGASVSASVGFCAVQLSLWRYCLVRTGINPSGRWLNSPLRSATH